MSDQPLGALPSLAAGDVYLYAHGNGAIYVGYADGRSMLVPLEEAVAVAGGCHDAGSQVVVAWEDAPLATDVVDRLRASGLPFAEFRASTAPHSWDHGTDALMEAAALGTDHLLDDLVARGADLLRRDASGSTALHHAAANGRLHAISALVAAGTPPDVANEQGATPRMLAVACREHEAARRLEALEGATTTPLDVAAPPIEFGRIHFGTVYVWVLPLLFLVIAVVASWPLPWFGYVGVAAFVVALAAVVPPWSFWAGGVARRLDGTVLTLRSPSGTRRTVDLADVAVAASGGSTSRSAFLGARWILLAHPDGVAVSPRGLRRLLVPPEEVAALAGRMPRVVVVPLDGARCDEVILPVGEVLAACGADLSPSLRAQVDRARTPQ